MEGINEWAEQKTGLWKARWDIKDEKNTKHLDNIQIQKKTLALENVQKCTHIYECM